MDIGNSFSAAAVTEDNLIDQLRNNGKQLVRATARHVAFQNATDALLKL